MGRIIVLSGESGTGKTTAAKELIKLGYNLVTSTTTRIQRDTDLSGEYEYVTVPDFVRLDQVGEFAWTANPYKNVHHGTRKTNLDAARNSLDDHLMILIPQIVPILLNYTNQVLPFFFDEPPIEELRRRLVERGDSAVNIEDRLSKVGSFRKEAKASGVKYVHLSTYEDNRNKDCNVLVKELLRHLDKI